MQENQQPPPGEDDLNPWAHCVVVWGNLLYEYSQFLASVGQVRSIEDCCSNRPCLAGMKPAASCPAAHYMQQLGQLRQSWHSHLAHIWLWPSPSSAAAALALHSR